MFAVLTILPSQCSYAFRMTVTIGNTDWTLKLEHTMSFVRIHLSPFI